LPNSKKHSVCVVSELNIKASLIEAAEKKLVRKSKEDRGFEVIQSPVSVNYGDADMIHYENAFLADKNGQDVQVNVSVWYFKTRSKPMRLVCDVEAEFFGRTNQEFTAIAQTIKSL